MVTKENSFELELAWCMAQLQISINDKKVSNKVKNENAQVSRQLASSKTLFPRKRQLMRSAFGDYRAKMKSHPLPELCSPSVCKGHEPEGVFYKVSASKSKQGDTPGAPEDQFTFQFNISVDKNN